MGGLALLFPGQASQAVGMGVDLMNAHAGARRLFEQVDAVTGLAIVNLCAHGPLERLTATEVAQPAVVTTSLAALAVLRDALGEALPEPRAVAGHSVGELAAYAAAGALDAPNCLQLVHVRAQAMADACARVDGTMAAVLGMDEEPLRAVCVEASDASGSVEIANLNAPGQLVISGERAAVSRAGDLARERGARRVLPLTVGGPFHSVYMHPAAERLQEAVAQAAVRDAATPVVVNVTGRAERDAAALRDELNVQVFSPVRWIDTLRTMAEMGCDRFLEVGPGQVLTGLVKRTLSNVRVASFGALADLDATRALVAAD